MLRHLRTYFEKSFPGIEVYLCFKEESIHSPVTREEIDRIFSDTKLKSKKRSFAYIREIKCDLQEHPIEAFLKESDLEVPILQKESLKNPQTYFLSPKGNIPTKSMTKEQIKKCIEMGKSKGCLYTEDFENADWVIGVENKDTYVAAFESKKVTLIQNGLGSDLFLNLFPAITLEKL